MCSPLVSVIVPVYNVEPYLPRCIESICVQTYQNLQIILVNDGSTDGSGKLCEDYAARDKRILVIHKENGGLVTARKTGLSAATGKYIGFVDGDDYIEPEMYEELLRYIEQTAVDFVHSGFTQESQKEEKAFLGFEEGEYDLTQNRVAFIKRMLPGKTMDVRKCMTYSIWSKLFRQDVIRKCYAEVPDSQQYGEDVIALYVCLLQCNRVALRKRTYYHYVVRENSLSNVHGEVYFTKELSLYKVLCDILKKQGFYPELAAMQDARMQYSAISYVETLYKPFFELCRYQYPDISELEGMKVIVWGAGKVGRDYYQQISKYQSCKIVAWCDSNPEKCHSEYCDIVGMEQMRRGEFDRIVIAVREEALAREIRFMLMENGQSSDRILWREPMKIF